MQLGGREVSWWPPVRCAVSGFDEKSLGIPNKKCTNKKQGVLHSFLETDMNIFAPGNSWLEDKPASFWAHFQGRTVNFGEGIFPEANGGQTCLFVLLER